jgi:hypothetical protein
VAVSAITFYQVRPVDWSPVRELRGRAPDRGTWRCPEPSCPVVYRSGPSRPCPDHDPAAVTVPELGERWQRIAALNARIRDGDIEPRICKCGCGELTPDNPNGSNRAYCPGHRPWHHVSGSPPRDPGGKCLCGCGELVPSAHHRYVNREHQLRARRRRRATVYEPPRSLPPEGRSS